jgi:hypothetical protein
VSDPESRHREDDAVETANDMLRRNENRTISPSGDALEGSPGAKHADIDGQLGPDEISEPMEVVLNNEVKRQR